MKHGKLALLLLACLLLMATQPSLLLAGSDDAEHQSKTMALPATHLFTLTLTEGGATHTFSMTVASRHFSMNLGEKNIAFRGRLWDGERGRQLLDYRLEFTQWIEGDQGKQRRGSTWNGSAHLDSGKPVEIATFIAGSFTVELETLD